MGEGVIYRITDALLVLPQQRKCHSQVECFTTRSPGPHNPITAPQFTHLKAKDLKLPLLLGGHWPSFLPLTCAVPSAPSASPLPSLHTSTSRNPQGWLLWPNILSLAITGPSLYLYQVSSGQQVLDSILRWQSPSDTHFPLFFTVLLNEKSVYQKQKKKMSLSLLTH